MHTCASQDKWRRIGPPFRCGCIFGSARGVYRQRFPYPVDSATHGGGSRRFAREAGEAKPEPSQAPPLGPALQRAPARVAAGDAANKSGSLEPLEALEAGEEPAGLGRGVPGEKLAEEGAVEFVCRTLARKRGGGECNRVRGTHCTAEVRFGWSTSIMSAAEPGNRQPPPPPRICGRGGAASGGLVPGQ